MQTVSPNTVHQSQYNEIIQRKSVAVWVRFAEIWDKIQHLYYSHAEVHIIIVPWRLLVNDTDLCHSPKSPKKSIKPPILALKVIQGHWIRRQSKGSIRFLLVINSNLSLISYRYWDTATYWPKIANFAHPLSFRAVVRADPLRIYGKALRFLKLESSRQLMVKIGDSVACTVFDWSTRVTDRRTDGRTELRWLRRLNSCLRA